MGGERVLPCRNETPRRNMDPRVGKRESEIRTQLETAREGRGVRICLSSMVALGQPFPA